MRGQQPVIYYRRGPVERRRFRIGWQRYDGFSTDTPAGNPGYPWKTRYEAQREASSRGGQAVFIDEKGERLP